MDKATADNRSVLSFAIIKTLDTGILLLALFKLELEMDYPSEIACVQSPPPPQTPLLRLFLMGGGGCGLRLKSETDNPSLTTILDKNLETLWKILLPFDFPIPFAMLL